MADRLAPTDDERALMQARVSDIDRWLSPSRRAAIVRAVELMRANLVIANSASDDAVDGYVVVLTPFPEPVIESVCKRFMDGRLGNRTYAPMAAEVAHECRLAVADALAERGRIALILDAEVYRTPTDAERADVARRHHEFVGATAKTADARSTRLTAAGTQASEQAQARADLERMRVVEVADEIAMAEGVADV